MSNLSLLSNLDLHFMLQCLNSISSLIEFILLIISGRYNCVLFICHWCETVMSQYMTLSVGGTSNRSAKLPVIFSSWLKMFVGLVTSKKWFELR